MSQMSGTGKKDSNLEDETPISAALAGLEKFNHAHLNASFFPMRGYKKTTRLWGGSEPVKPGC
jgi:hypothetical protein